MLTIIPIYRTITHDMYVGGPEMTSMATYIYI